MTHHETNFVERSSREMSHAQFPVHQGNGKSGSMDSHPSGSPVGKTYSNANGSMLPLVKVVEFRDRASDSHSPENIREANHSSLTPQNSSMSLSPGGAHRPKSMLSMHDDRYGNFIIRAPCVCVCVCMFRIFFKLVLFLTFRSAVHTYHLKDEDDFPPLSV